MWSARLFAKLIKTGTLTLVGPDGSRHVFGGESLRPALAAGEAYMEGTLTVEEGSLYDFLALASHNLRRTEARGGVRAGDRLARWLRRIHQHNPVGRARRNAAHHYDLRGDFYRLFLDEDLQYSCAYFSRPGMSLEEAQAAKKQLVAAKLLLAPGQWVLDVGCGWGGLALTLAATADVEVVGVTLSREQWEVARRRADEAGLADRVRFDLADYRTVKGTFEIVSVGMFEHVGYQYYPEFFAIVRDRLAENGVAFLHSIGRPDGPGVTNPWIRKYIFPGGYSPALSEAVAAVERYGLTVTDVEILRGHYALTLREWRRRFEASRDRAKAIYGERFCRMWEFYLAGAEATFSHQGQMVFQMQLAKSPDTVPITRDYLSATEVAGGEQRFR